MAKFTFDEACIDQTLIDQVIGLENTEEYVPNILKAAAVPLEAELKKQCSRHRRTGSMVNSIKASKPANSKDGWYIAVRPTGKSNQYIDRTGKLRTRKTPVRNMELLAYIEHGTSKQAKEPVISTAVQNSREACESAIQQAYNRIVEGGDS